ncbi:MAG: hypothetical protein A2511_06245 [Deltaproteobacteria bacterium RIFOXYD12_FULL_50_9]|nr:MAG: hypothetical protein A2511_06245 [Deltaproteobacteria bacterium RIFOXYD12_FULL_50_9]
MPDRETFQQLKNIGKDRRYSIRERRISHKPFHLQENNGIDRRSKERRSASHENIISRKPFQLPENNGKDRRLTIFIIALLLVIVAMILSVSAVVRSYGPYLGRVVDAETGIPLANVEVLIRFYTEYHLQLEEPTSQVAEAIETLTDKQGEFQVPVTWVYSFRFFHLWRPHALVTIFKPGYGTFPGHPGTTPQLNPQGAVPENKPVVIKMPRLKTREERWFNLNVAFLDLDVPSGKGERFKRLIEEEKVHLGWVPGRKGPDQKEW